MISLSYLLTIPKIYSLCFLLSFLSATKSLHNCWFFKRIVSRVASSLTSVSSLVSVSTLVSVSALVSTLVSMSISLSFSLSFSLSLSFSSLFFSYLSLLFSVLQFVTCNVSFVSCNIFSVSSFFRCLYFLTLSVLVDSLPTISENVSI